MNVKGKPLPSLHSDEEAERFVATADLSEYDLSEFKPMRFDMTQATLNMRLPAALLEAVRARAKAQGMSHARHVQMVLEADLQQSH